MVMVEKYKLRDNLSDLTFFQLKAYTIMRTIFNEIREEQMKE